MYIHIYFNSYKVVLFIMWAIIGYKNMSPP